MSDLLTPDLIYPDWLAPANVRAFTTTRIRGYSQNQWSNFNLGNNCGDKPEHVAKNRQELRKALPVKPQWLKQVHGKRVVILEKHSGIEPEADAAVSTKKAQVCAILHADCLPVLFCNQEGTKVAAVHAGWRGLAKGVLEATIAVLACKPASLMAWLGPAIGPQAFEVGQDVFDAFIGLDAENNRAFVNKGDRWMADLYQLVNIKLSKAGIEAVSGGQFCTYTEKNRFYSYRRDGQTGRMATVIWLDS